MTMARTKQDSMLAKNMMFFMALFVYAAFMLFALMTQRCSGKQPIQNFQTPLTRPLELLNDRLRNRFFTMQGLTALKKPCQRQDLNIFSWLAYRGCN